VTPIRLVPWQAPFLPVLADFLATLGPKLADTVLVFPHNRPARFLTRLLAAHPALPKPCVLPEMTAYADWIDGLARRLTGTPLRRATRLDCIGLLYEIVSSLQREGRGLIAGLPLDRRRFFSWGARLADLLDELLRHGREPANLDYLEFEVLPFAAALLSELKTIYDAYRTALTARGWTTHGLDCATVAAEPGAVTGLLAGKHMVVAGFYALSGSEEKIFKALWQSGQADVFWHGDAALGTGRPAHWSAAEHAAWLKRWGADVRLETAEPERAPTRFRFVEGFDLHSQLARLDGELAAAPDLDGAALVLPKTGLLLPVLHHLRGRETNISMGYPLARSALAELVEIILRLQEGRGADGRYHWRELIDLVRHPYVKMLGTGEAASLRLVLHGVETWLRGGGTFVDPWEFRVDPDLASPAELTAAEGLRAEILAACLTGFTGLASLRDLARALRGLGQLLTTRGRHLWTRHLLDAECLVRLIGKLTVELESSLESDAAYPQDVLFTVLRELLAAERVPFEPDPLSGLQVLGFLESRLLTFRRLFILDVTDDNLPGAPGYDPLLPDALRSLLGLPDMRERDHVTAANFYRLVRGAEEATIFYQAGVQPGELQGKTLRSRYVEELLWEEEKRRGRLVEPGEEPLALVSFPVRGIPRDSGAIKLTPAIRAALLKRLKDKGLSPSGLDVYLACPKRFFYQYLTGIGEVTRVSEEGDPAELGELVHKALQDYLAPFLNLPLAATMLDPDDLARELDARLRLSDFFRQMPYDRQVLLALAARKRLSDYLENFPETTVLAQERSVAMTVAAPALSVKLHGRVDRIDRRPEGVLLLDYKTGSVKKPRQGFFGDEELFSRMLNWEPGADDELLADIASGANSLQLPAYLAMYAAEPRFGSALDAAFVSLRDKGQEEFLFGPKMDPEQRETVLATHIPAVLACVVGQLATAETFAPRLARHCDWCPYRSACGA